jgi:hypothetical protein
MQGDAQTLDGIAHGFDAAVGRLRHSGVPPAR